MQDSFRRFHQLRSSQIVRDQNAEVHLEKTDFILPYFVVDGTKTARPISTLTGVFQFSIDKLVESAKRTFDDGIDKVLLFGVVTKENKNPNATAAIQTDSLVSRAVEALKKSVPGLCVMTDVCVCAYTDHGHCGIFGGNAVDNDATLPVLAKMALSHAQAGADFVAPSAMMDGQVQAIRALLNENKLPSTRIMGYSAKYASKLYGPFRDAADSAPSFGDRRAYQMDFRTREQGVLEAVADLEEGADVLMVKPSTFYLDMLCRIKTRMPQTPLAAYHTSGEYMMLVHGSRGGLFTYEKALMENLFAIKRAGADWIITYAALDAAKLLQDLS